jgi:ketosteroid isomerase-like protein
MRWLITIVLFFSGFLAIAQQETDVVQRMKEFHELMVQGSSSVKQYLDDSLSYGHSNGWIENKKDFISDLGTRIDYHSIKEDSIHAGVNGKVAHIRFIGLFDATLDGKQNQFRLRVLEIWVKKKKGWKIFARQAVRL